jgi:hypothetical protein
MTAETQRIVREIPDPKPGDLACPHCGNDELRTLNIIALTQKDPERSLHRICRRTLARVLKADPGVRSPPGRQPLPAPRSRCAAAGGSTPG